MSQPPPAHCPSLLRFFQRLKLDILKSIKIHKIQEVYRKEEEIARLKRVSKHDHVQKRERGRIEKEQETLGRRKEFERRQREKTLQLMTDKTRLIKEKPAKDPKRKNAVTRITSLLYLVLSIGFAALLALLILFDSRTEDSNIWYESTLGVVVFLLLIWAIWRGVRRLTWRGLDKPVVKSRRRKSRSASPPYMGSQVLFPPKQSSARFYGPNHDHRRK